MIKKWAVLLILCFVGLACAHGRTPATAADREAIDEIRREFAAAETAGSTERMRVHITEDVVMMAPNMPSVSGADNAMAAMRGFFDTFGMRIQYSSEEIVVTSGWAFDRGTYTQTLMPKLGGATLSDSGKYLWLYRREPDGRWKQARVIWNTDAPTAAAPSN